MFSVANAIGFASGMVMFGAIIFISLFLQIVYGASPTASGLPMLPLIAWLLVATISSGQVITRIGRYKAFPIAGTAILIVGMYLLSLLRVGTAPWLHFVYGVAEGKREDQERWRTALSSRRCTWRPHTSDGRRRRAGRCSWSTNA